jgi:gpW
MGYSEADLESVRQARLKLARGERVVETSVGNQRTTWQQTQAADLERYENQIAAALARDAGGTGTVVAATSKGVY